VDFLTATQDFLGTEKWTVGPTGLLIWDLPDWKIGVLAGEWRSFAGAEDRPNVSKANI
jgi:hypothetical protein